MNIIAFGPQLVKKKVNAYKITKAMWLLQQYFDGLVEAGGGQG
jgi:hypothetical protein